MNTLAPAQIFLNGKVELRPGDCRDVIREMEDNSIDSVVCDPPYALVSIVKRFGGPNAAPANNNDVYARASSGFMGKQWDTGETAFATEFWAEVLRVLKPGGHVVAFSGTRTYHRMAVAIEDVGFEIRDQLAWMYGSGFPKSHDVSKGIDKAAGAERDVVGKGQSGKTSLMGGLAGVSGGSGHNLTAPATNAAREWQGWGTALKPAWEPICLARKPLAVPIDDIRDADGPAVRMRPATVAANVLEHGTGALNIDGCRVGEEERGRVTTGRWPANIVHDGSDEVLAGFPDSQSTIGKPRVAASGDGWGMTATGAEYADSGSAARFFYTAKADKLDRIGSKHPTVKPVDLMQWLCRMVTPPGGVVLDPFAGSGSTGEAAWREGFRCILIEREEEYQADIAARLRLADKGPATRRQRAIKQAANDDLPLFAPATPVAGAA